MVFIDIEHPTRGKIRVFREISKDVKDCIENFYKREINYYNDVDEYYGKWIEWQDKRIEIDGLYHVKTEYCVKGDGHGSKVVIEKVDDFLNVYPKSIYSVTYNKEETL